MSALLELIECKKQLKLAQERERVYADALRDAARRFSRQRAQMNRLASEIVVAHGLQGKDAKTYINDLYKGLDGDE